MYGDNENRAANTEGRSLYGDANAPKYLTDLSFLNKGMMWPPQSQSARLTKYEQNRLLFDSKHDKVYRDWVRLLREDHQAIMKIIINFHKRLSTLWADLLLGEPPRIKVGDADSPEQQNIERIIKRSKFVNTAYEAGLDVSRFGTGIFKVRFEPARGSIIDVNNPAVWFPVVDPDNVKNVLMHVLAWTFVQNERIPFGLGYKQVTYLKTEVHERGKITTTTYRLKGDKITDVVDGPNEVMTGIDEFLIVPVNNLVTSEELIGQDDYTDIDTIIQEIEIRWGQISRILDKHSDPNMAGPYSALELDQATGEYKFRAAGKYFPLNDGEEAPKYITWEGQLSQQFSEIDKLIEQLYVVSETSPAAFGQLKTGLAESGSALRRLMMAPLAKVNRIRLRFDPALKEVLEIATKLEKAQGFAGAIELGESDIHITWNDGLPQDDQEQTSIVTAQYKAGLVSLETALQRLFGLEGEALQEEIARIRQAQQTAAPAGPTITLPPRNDKNTNSDPTLTAGGGTPATPQPNGPLNTSSGAGTQIPNGMQTQVQTVLGQMNTGVNN